MARKFTRSRGRSGAPRESLWLFANVAGATLASASTASLLFSYNAAALALRPFTIVRTRGVFGVKSDQIATQEDFDAAVSMSVVSDQAVAIGVTAVPTPATDMGSDMFFVYEMLFGTYEDRTAAGFESNGLTSMQFDSKAMRRVNDDQDLAVTLETSSVSNGVNVRLGFRQLIKLH